jgi:hypothetical protein
MTLGGANGRIGSNGEVIMSEHLSDLADAAIVELGASAARGHAHDENCGSFAYAVGYLTSGIDMFLAGRTDAQQLRADSDRAWKCLHAAGRI